MLCTLQLKVLEVEEVEESDTDPGQNNMLHMKNIGCLLCIRYPFRADIVPHNYFAMAPHLAAISQLRLACS